MTLDRTPSTYTKACVACNGRGSVNRMEMPYGYSSQECQTCAGRGFTEHRTTDETAMLLTQSEWDDLKAICQDWVGEKDLMYGDGDPNAARRHELVERIIEACK